MQNDPRLARLEHVIREQDERDRQREARREREIAALRAHAPDLTDDRLVLIDRIEQRCPSIGKVADHEVEWRELPEGDFALVLDRSGMPEGRGAYFMNNGEDVLAIGPLGEVGATGVVSIKPDGTTELLTVAPGPDLDT